MDIYIADIRDRKLDNKQMLEILSQQEIEAYYKRNSITYLMTRVLVREILAEKLNTSLKSIEFSISPSGRPYVKNSNIFFNISHSKDLIVLAVSHNNIGVDLEYGKERDYIKLLNYLNRINVINNLPKIKGDDLKRKFYILWTRYEANIKFHSKKRFTPTINNELKYYTYYNDGYYLSIAFKNMKNIKFYSKSPSLKPILIETFPAIE